MRCPKCHYLSFDPEPRCRNCGYGLALEVPEAEAESGPDLPLTTSTEEDDPLADLMLRTRPQATPDRDDVISLDRHDPAQDASAVRIRGPFDDPVAAPPSTGLAAPPPVDEISAPAKTVAATKRTIAPPTTELPLFMTQSTLGEPDLTEPDISEPMVRVPAEPRPPLAVRRPNSETPSRAAAPAEPRRKLGPLDRDLLEDLQRFEKQERKDAAAETRAAGRASRSTDLPGAASRLAAATIDAALLAGLSAGVLAITLRWLDLSFDQIRILPIVPTAAFLLIVSLGYLLMFTAAGGQTIGKMAAGIRVVDEAGDEGEAAPVSVRQALFREVLTIPSVLAVGAGFFPGLVGEQRALHDRIAHTRVVRA